MKKLSTFLCTLFAIASLQAQVLFEQDFENGLAPMTIEDVDGLTPAANVAQWADAWTVANPTFGNGSNLAVSNSWYTPAGTANDWMITPAISITATNTVISWEAKAQDATFPDGYEVRVSTTGTNIADFTDVVFSVGAENPAWTDRLAGLGDYAGQTIHIAFRNNSVDMFLLLVDNIQVKVQQPFDIALTALSTTQFHTLSTPITIAGTITNEGGNVIESFDLNWTDGTNNYSETISGLSVAPGATYDFTHGTTFSAAAAQSYTIEVSVDNPNGEVDGNPDNNELSTVVSGVTFIPQKRVVAEEGTGTWCGWCPRGFYWMSYMYDNYPETFIGIAVHNGDPMVVTDYDNSIGFSAYPSAHIDRTNLNTDPGDFLADYQVAVQNISPIDIAVTATYAEDAPELLTINASAEFVTALDGIDYRFAGVIMEDEVVGTGTPYNQANFYSSTAANIPLSGYGYDWQALPNPVLAEDMVYPDVARALLGGFDGVVSSIPASVSAGQSVEYTFEYTVPADVNIEHVRAAVWIIDNATGRILNADVEDATVATNVTEIVASNLVKVFPNPFQGELNLQINLDQAANVDVQLFNALGQLVATQTYGTLVGEQTLSFNAPSMANGLYTVVVKAGNQVSTQRVVLQR